MSHANKADINKLRDIRNYRIKKIQMELAKIHANIKQANQELEEQIIEAKSFYQNRKSSQTNKFNQLQKEQTVTVGMLDRYTQSIHQLKEEEETLKDNIEEKKVSIIKLEDELKKYAESLKKLHKKIEGLNLLDDILG